MAVVLFSAALYLIEAEGPNRDDYDSIFNAGWFVLVTLTTVGYGDVSPATDAGKAVTCCLIIAGVLFTAMPLTIVGNNFASVWQEKEAIRVVLKLQELLVTRKLRAGDVMLIFDEFDLDHNGLLDLGEFKELLETLGLKLTHDKSAHLFNFFDVRR